MSQPIAAAKFYINLFCEIGLERRCARQVVELFDRHPGPVCVRLTEKAVELPKSERDNGLAWADAFKALQSLRVTYAIPNNEYTYLLTGTANEQNWYSVNDPAFMRNAFGHVGDFTWATSAPNHAIVAHYMLKSVFNAILADAGLGPEHLWHKKPRGCFNDFCQNKVEINLKLRTADICGDCLQVYKAVGLPDELLAQAVGLNESVRKTALNTRQYMPKGDDFADWPFPVAVTRHKAIQADNPLLKFMLLLDHFDSLVRYFYLAHEISKDRKPVIEERPSLGWWVDRLSHSLSGEKYFREVISIAQQDKVVNLRNEMRGHGWMRPNEEHYREIADRLEQTLGKIEDELRPFLDKYRLVIPRNIGLKDGSYLIEGEQLTGSHILHPRFSHKSATEPRALGISEGNLVYLTDSNMTNFRPISPYIRYQLCPTCSHQRLLVTDGGRQYIDVFIGHRVNL